MTEVIEFSIGFSEKMTIPIIMESGHPLCHKRRSEVHLLSLPARGVSEVLPAFLGRRCEGEVDVATHIPVVFVLINQLRYEFRSEGD